MRSGKSQFIESLNRIPVTEVFRAIEHECQTLERGECGERLSLDEGAISVLSFRRFLNAAMLGVRLTHSVLPAEHFAAYKKSISRLVKAGRLPVRADKEFDRTFSSDQK